MKGLLSEGELFFRPGANLSSKGIGETWPKIAENDLWNLIVVKYISTYICTLGQIEIHPF